MGAVGGLRELLARSAGGPAGRPASPATLPASSASGAPAQFPPGGDPLRPDL